MAGGLFGVPLDFGAVDGCFGFDGEAADFAVDLLLLLLEGAFLTSLAGSALVGFFSKLVPGAGLVVSRDVPGIAIGLT